MQTKCNTIRCLKTVGERCSHSEEYHELYGDRCGGNLRCGCDKKCTGCMIVNGVEKCHEDSLICLSPPHPGKRNEQLFDNQDESDYATFAN